MRILEPLAIPLVAVFVGCVGYWFALAVAFEEIIDHLRRSHPEEWEAAGYPAGYFVPNSKGMLGGIVARGMLSADLLSNTPDWVADDTRIVDALRKVRRRTTGLYIAFGVYIALFVVAVVT